MALTTLDPCTALIVIDLHGGVVGATQPYSGPEVVARTVGLAEAFRAAGLPVVLVRVSFADDGADAVPGRTERQRAGGGARPEGWDVVVDELAGHPGDIHVVKRNWGAFHGTDLDVQLRGAVSRRSC